MAGHCSRDVRTVVLVAVMVVGLSWITGPVAMTAFLAAFPLGLADPSGTIEPAVHTEQPVPA